MHDASETPTTSLSAWAWTWWVLATTAGLCAAVVAFNAAIDPTAQLGTSVLPAQSRAAPDRNAKVQLLDAATPPQIVVLGSSRSKKLDPAWLGLDGAHGINAAVVGGDLFEARVLTAWLAGRMTSTNVRFPQLVIGVDVEQFRDSSLTGSGMLQLPEIEGIARREAGGAADDPADRIRRAQRLLLSWQTTRASLAATRARLGTAAAPEDTATDADASATSALNERGVLRSDERWLGGDAFRLAARTPQRIDASITAYRATYANNGAQLDQAAVADLRAVLEHARAAGGTPPLVYITPAHPQFVTALRDAGQRQRYARVRTLLSGYERAGLARFIDCLSCIGPASTNWIDAVHPSPRGMQELARRLKLELGQAPSATPTERSGDSR